MSQRLELEMASSLLEKGQELYTQAKVPESIQCLDEAATIFHRYENWVKYVECSNHIARACIRLSDFDRAQSLMEDMILQGSYKLAPSHPQIGFSYSYLGTCYYQQGNIEKAYTNYQTALNIWLDAYGEQHHLIAMTYSNIGNYHSKKSQIEKALSYYKKALAIRSEVLEAEHIRFAYSYTSIGVCFFCKDELDKALIYFEKALHIRRKHFGDDHPELTHSYDVLGDCYRDKGQFKLALVYYNKSLKINQKNYGEIHPSIASCYANIADIYRRQESFESSLQFLEKALLIQREIFGEKTAETAMTYGQIGLCHYNQGKHSFAIQYLEKSLAINIDVFGLKNTPVALSYNHLAYCYLKQEAYFKSLSFFQRSLISLMRDFDSMYVYHNPKLENYSSPTYLLNTLHQKADILYQLYLQKDGEEATQVRNLHSSCETYQLCIELIDQRREDYKMESSKMTLAEDVMLVYENAIAVALEMDKVEPENPKWKELAFSIAEKGKAIVLLSSLKELEARSRANIPPELLDKEQQLRIDLNYLEQSIQERKVKMEGSLNDRQDMILDELKSRFFDYTEEYEQLIDQFEQAYPDYYRLKYSIETVTIADAQNYIRDLKDSTAIVAYFAGLSDYYLFLITEDDFDIKVIPSTEELKTLVDDFSDALNEVEIEDYVQAAWSLYELLVKPIEAKISDKEHLIFICDDLLNYLPFDALINKCQTKVQQYSELSYLIKDYQISYHYSVTLLVNGALNRGETNLQKNSFLGIAPVTFGNEQEEVDIAIESNQGQTHVLRSNNAGVEALQQLPSSGAEVKQVYELFEERALDAQVFLYQSASKQNLLKYAGQHKYVLIATHGYASTSGRQNTGIVLSAPNAAKSSQTNTRDTRIDRNQILYTSEAYLMKLRADLVVLSCCKSGVGANYKGEGVWAINRGFLYAGASNIIFTYFDIPDESSSELVKTLFENILQGDKYAAALQKAKWQMLENERLSPQDWAGFGLIGDG